MTLFQLSYVLLWMLALVLALATVVLLYLLAQIQTRSERSWLKHGLSLLGRDLPLSMAKDIRTGIVPAARLFHNQPHVVLVLSPVCGSCSRLINELKGKPQDEIGGLPLLLVCVGDFQHCEAAASGVGSTPVLVLDGTDDEATNIRLTGFPTAIVVNQAGIVVHVQHSTSIGSVETALKALDTSSGYPTSYRTREPQVAQAN